MSGTSCDGVDFSCLSFSHIKDKNHLKALWSEQVPYPYDLRERVLEIQKPAAVIQLKEFLLLDRDLGLFYAKAASKILSRLKQHQRPDAWSLHGQTVAHYPYEKPVGITSQIGSPFLMATQTGITVIHSLRNGDVSGGGQGAPMLPPYHWILCEKIFGPKEVNNGYVFQNLGGISNISFKIRSHEMSFDTGTANLWIDRAVEAYSDGKMKYDEGGDLARKGKINHALLKKWMEHPFLKLKPPKSTGRDDFTDAMLFSGNVRGLDLISTATEYSVLTITRAYQDFILNKYNKFKNVLVAGGGTKNYFLLEGIRTRLPTLHFQVIEESNAIEAQGFAYLGWLTLNQQPLGGTWTGVKKWACPGSVIPGKNFKALMKKMN